MVKAAGRTAASMYGTNHVIDGCRARALNFRSLGASGYHFGGDKVPVTPMGLEWSRAIINLFQCLRESNLTSTLTLHATLGLIYRFNPLQLASYV